MARRRTRDEAVQAESKAVRLAARGLGVREIAQVRKLSESEARRKLQRGWEQLGEEADHTYARAQVEADLQEVLRTAYRAVDGGRPGSPPQVGALKVVLQAIAFRARLRGIELERPNVAVFDTAPDAEGPLEERRLDRSALAAPFRELDDKLNRRRREVIEVERGAGAENVRPPERPPALPAAQEEEI